MTTSDANNPFAPSADDAFAPPRRLVAAFDCWHESMHSARNDAVVALGPRGAFIATDRPVPAGTEIFIEFEINATQSAEIDAVVVWSEVEGLESQSGFGVKFVDVDTAVRDWIVAQDFAAEGAAPPAHLAPPQADLAEPGIQAAFSAPENDDATGAHDAPDRDAPGENIIAAAAAASDASRLPAGTPRLMNEIDALTATTSSSDGPSSEFESVASAPMLSESTLSGLDSDRESEGAAAPAFDFAATDDAPAPSREQLLQTATLTDGEDSGGAESPATAETAASTSPATGAFSALPPEALEGIDEDDILAGNSGEGEPIALEGDAMAAEDALSATFDASTAAPPAVDGVTPALDADAPAPPAFDVDTPPPAFDVDTAPPALDADAPAPPDLDADAPAPPDLDADAPAPPALDLDAPALPTLDVDAPAPPDLDTDAPAPPAFDFPDTGGMSASFGAAFDAPTDGVNLGATPEEAPASDAPAPHIDTAAVDLSALERSFEMPSAADILAETSPDTVAAIANSGLPRQADPDDGIDLSDEIELVTLPPASDVADSKTAADLTATPEAESADGAQPPGPDQVALTDSAAPQTLGALFEGEDEPVADASADAPMVLEDASADLAEAFAVAPQAEAAPDLGAFEGGDGPADLDPLAALDNAFETPPTPPATPPGDPLAPAGENPFGTLPDADVGPELTPAAPTQNPFIAGAAPSALDALESAFDATPAPAPPGALDVGATPSQAPTLGELADAAEAEDNEQAQPAPENVVTLDSLEGGPVGEQIDLASMEGAPLALDAAFGEGGFGEGGLTSPESNALGGGAFGGDMELTFFDDDGGPPQPVPMTNEGPTLGSEEALTPLPTFDNQPALSQEPTAEAAVDHAALEAQGASLDLDAAFDMHAPPPAEGTASGFGLAPAELPEAVPLQSAPEPSGPSPVAVGDDDPLTALPDMSLSDELSAPNRMTPPHTPPDSAVFPSASATQPANVVAAPKTPTSTLQFGAYQDPPPTPVGGSAAPAPGAPAVQSATPTSTLQFGAYQDPVPTPTPAAVEAPAGPAPVPQPLATPDAQTAQPGAFDASPTPPSKSVTPTLQFGAYQDPPAPEPTPDPNLELSLSDATGLAAPVVVDTSLFETPSEELDPFSDHSSPNAGALFGSPQTDPGPPPLPSDASVESQPPTAPAPDPFGANAFDANALGASAPVEGVAIEGTAIEGTPIEEEVELDVDLDLSLSVPSRETWTVPQSAGAVIEEALEIDLEGGDDDELPVVTGSTLLLDDDGNQPAAEGGALDEAWVVASSHNPGDS